MIRLRFVPPASDADWDAWIQEGHAAVAEMLADTTGKRDIKERLYKRQRDRFLAATHKKCAYCELLLTPGQRQGDVEHYRPKKRARRMDGKVVKVLRDGVEIDHPGYYWLAYDYLNLLPSCSACNRRAGDAASGTNTGKSDIFPTLDDHWAARPEDVPAEQPALLNPWLDDPAEHLCFDRETGRIIDRTERGRITIDLLGLNRDGLPEARKLACENLRRAFKDVIDDVTSRRAVGAAAERVVQSAQDGSAEYAAFCREEYLDATKELMEFLTADPHRPHR